MKPELLVDAKTQLGEGPAWETRLNELCWLDIFAGEVRYYNPESAVERIYQIGEPVGCAAPCESGNIILGLRSGIAKFKFPKAIEMLARPEQHLPGNRFNDGKCDPAGRFLAGTMDNAEQAASGALYSYAPDGTLKTLISGVRISNGLAWSPDYQTFYYIDTPTRVVMAYDYDLDTGDINNPRPVVHIPHGMGWPDGMTSDAEGNLWVALWGGAAVTCWDPATGSLVRRVDVPAWNVTSCVFGGPGLTEFYITSARKGMSDEELARYPLSGGLFRLRMDVQGMPTFRFRDV